MGIDSDIHSLIIKLLQCKLRYRCLVFQYDDLSLLSLSTSVIKNTAVHLGGAPEVIRWDEIFDNIGALACTDVIERLETIAVNNPVILVGPLHFLDYWSDKLCTFFWNHLSSFSHGPGIIIQDIVRTNSILGPFQIYGRMKDTNIRYLKSRLATAEVGTA